MKRVGQWVRRQAPTRESFENSRFLAPFAHRVFHPALWRFTRRSVPRGVALGLLVGIFLLLPGVQIVGVALLALPVRANIPVGAAMTFLSMPLTTPFILIGAGYIGGVDVNYVLNLYKDHAPISAYLDWILSDAAPLTLFGLAVISVAAAVIGYVLSALFWRWWIANKWRRRSKSLAARG